MHLEQSQAEIQSSLNIPSKKDKKLPEPPEIIYSFDKKAVINELLKY